MYYRKICVCYLMSIESVSVAEYYCNLASPTSLDLYTPDSWLVENLLGIKSTDVHKYIKL